MSLIITPNPGSAADLSDGTIGTGAIVLATSPTISAPTISGHPVVEGVTSTGATGTGNFVFGTSPTIATPTLGAITSSALIANKAIPVFASSGNATMPSQAAMWSTRWNLWGAQLATLPTNMGIGGGAVNSGTFTNPTQANTSLYTAQFRGAWATVVTTANQQVGWRGPATNYWFRGGTAGQGGFFFVCRFGIEAWTAGDRLFVGMNSAPTTCVTGQPSANVNMCGFGIDATDTAITFMHNDGSGTATKTAIAGTTLASLQGYDAYIFMKPNDGTIYYRLDDVNAGTTLVDASTATDVPAANTTMGANAVMGNAANALVTAAQIGIVSVYVESDR